MKHTRNLPEPSLAKIFIKDGFTIFQTIIVCVGIRLEAPRLEAPRLEALRLKAHALVTCA